MNLNCVKKYLALELRTLPSASPRPNMRLPRLGALAEVDWSPKEARDWESFQARAALNETRLDALDVNYRPLSKPD